MYSRPARPTQIACDFDLVYPVLRQLGNGNASGFHPGACHLQQRKVRLNVIGAGVDADLQQGPGRAFGQVHDAMPGMVPAAGQPAVRLRHSGRGDG